MVRLYRIDNITACIDNMLSDLLHICNIKHAHAQSLNTITTCTNTPEYYDQGAGSKNHEDNNSVIKVQADQSKSVKIMQKRY